MDLLTLALLAGIGLTFALVDSKALYPIRWVTMRLGDLLDGLAYMCTLDTEFRYFSDTAEYVLGCHQCSGFYCGCLLFFLLTSYGICGIVAGGLAVSALSYIFGRLMSYIRVLEILAKEQI